MLSPGRCRFWRIAMLLAVAACGPELCAQAADAAGLQMQVAETVRSSLGLDGSTQAIAGNVRLLPVRGAISNHAEVQLMSARPGWVRGTWLLRLDCSRRRDCLPFHAVLYYAHSIPCCSANVSTYHNVVHKSDSVRQPLESGLRRLRPDPAVHTGEHVRVAEERSGLHLMTQAVCLESGAVGDTISVRNLSSRRLLYATVAASGLVRVE